MSERTLLHMGTDFDGSIEVSEMLGGDYRLTVEDDTRMASVAMSKADLVYLAKFILTRFPEAAL